MTQGGCKAARDGFTIVEVLIVLAVSSLMFVLAVTIISGRQNKTEFTTAINDLRQQLQQTINETASGYYPNSGNFTCSPSSTGAVTLQTLPSGSGNAQGTNGGCIFLGKAIQFGLDTSGAKASQLGVLPLVGNQYQGATTTPVLHVAQSRPRAVVPGTDEVGVPDISTIDVMENGLTVAAGNSACGVGLGGMCYTAAAVNGSCGPLASGGSTVATGMAAFVAGDPQGCINALDSNGNLQAGSQQLSLYAVSGGAPNQPLAQASTSIGGTTSTYVSNLVAAQRISICIASGTTNQSGLFTIDAGLHVSLAVKGDLTC